MQLHLTPREHERLRQVSYEKQVERGLSHAGSSGLTSDRFGDSEPWASQGKRGVEPDGAAHKQGHGGSPDSHRTLGRESEERKPSEGSQQ